MNGSTKILTVSYGTFSCTLEGFDDPLESMRDIAEYFRDLAADDRYFGAEPPTPDVEMLQNIAQQDVRRRVEARVSETGVALVATDQVVEKDATAVEAPTSDSDTGGPLTFDDEFLMSDEPEDVLAVDPGAKTEADGPAESVAEKLRRIRAVVSRSIEEEESARVETNDTFGQSHAPKRDRALTDTIEQISAGLSDDEESWREGSDSDQIEDAVELSISSDGDEVDEDFIDPASEHVQEVSSDDEDTQAQAGTSEAEYEDVDSGEDDDNSDLARTVSDVLGRISAENAKVDVEDQKKPTRPITRTLEQGPEEDVGRLLDETDNKLNEDETVHRRRVISQMRAAVAATNADRLVSRQVSREDEEEAEKDRYREDFSEAVQDTTRALPERKPSTSPPLMLVSSQRIDPKTVELSEVPEPKVETESSSEPEGFAAFAESVGAKELHELLEAAAAYTVFAEGQSSFTRPEIMKRVARVDPTIRMSREDSLRSFGQLLRQGKFRKLERGQFTIEKTTKFHPEHRFAGE